MKPAINNRGVVLKKTLFEGKNGDRKCKKPGVNKLDACRAQAKGVAKKASTKQTESWYCVICCEDKVKDMILC